MKFQKLVLISAVIVFSISANTGSADDQERAQISIDTRQGLLKVVGYYIGPMVGMARGQLDYDADLVSKNAEKMAQLTAMIPDLFKMDTSQSGLKSDSLATIWENTQDFNEKAVIVSERANALAKAAKQGKGEFMKAFGATGAACKSCHDDYRQKQ